VSGNKIKNLLLEMGSALADKGFVWTKEMKAAFNKAVAYLEKKKPITS
jgi:hypothetical protein